MKRMLKQCLHLGGLLALGALVFTGNRASAITLPLPISTCQTLLQNTNYALTANITISTTGSCFIVGPNSTLDLQNHTITKITNHVGAAITDNGIAAPNVVVVNGTLTGFGTGIKMTALFGDSFNLTADNVKANFNTVDGIASTSCCNTVSNSQAEHNGNDGINFTGDGCCNTISNVNTSSNGEQGLHTQDCCSLASAVTSNHNTDGDGIEMEGDDNVLIGSTANLNGGDGVDMCCEVNFVQSVTANGNFDNGIFAGDGCCNLVDHASASGNSTHCGECAGILAFGNDNLVSNSVANQQVFGILLVEGTGNIVLRDTTPLNGIGVEIDCPSNVVRLISNANIGADLCEFDTNCSNVNNFAPKFNTGACF